MHPALEKAKRHLDIRRMFRAESPLGYTPPNLKHDQLVPLKISEGPDHNGTKHFLYIRVCPKCMCGYAYDVKTAQDDEIRVITSSQWQAQVKPYKTQCDKKLKDLGG